MPSMLSREGEAIGEGGSVDAGVVAEEAVLVA